MRQGTTKKWIDFRIHFLISSEGSLQFIIFRILNSNEKKK
jgi:hypothetical protein